MSEVTQLLNAAEQGDPKAAAQLLPLIYEELRRLAAHKMANEAAGQTLQPTALVHEAWLRLSGPKEQQWQNRRHFFGAAAEAMRRILVERARHRRSLKRGGNAAHIDIAELEISNETKAEALLALDEALVLLAAEDSQAAEVVKLRFFAGLGEAEVASVLGVSERTVRRAWTFARAWLFARIRG